MCVCRAPTWLWLKQLCHRLAYFPSHKLAHKHYDPKRVDYWHDRRHRFVLRPYAIMEDILCLVPSPPIYMSRATIVRIPLEKKASNQFVTKSIELTRIPISNPIKIRSNQSISTAYRISLHTRPHFPYKYNKKIALFRACVYTKISAEKKAKNKSK